MPRPDYHPDMPSAIPCPIAFIGEAPSDEEMVRGRPLVGPAGRLFNSMLRTSGIDRSDHFVGNVFDFKLPDNDVRNICGGAAEWKLWRADGYDLPPITHHPRALWLRPEFVGQLDRLAAEIAAVKPRVIVPLGGTALWAFTGYSKIMARRGAVCEATMTVPGAKLLPTLHPALVLRQYKYYVVCVSDFIKAVQETQREGLSFPDREIWVKPTLEDLWAFKAKYLDPARYISVDIETGWGQITMIGFAPDPYHGLNVPFWNLADIDRSYWPTPEEEVKALEFVEAVLHMPQPKVMQNGTYDTQWIYDRWGIATHNYSEDTRLQHHAMYPQLPKDLGVLGSVYARIPAWKLMRSRKATKREE